MLEREVRWVMWACFPGRVVLLQMSALAGPQMTSLKKSSCRMAPVQGVKSDGTNLGVALLAGMGMPWFDLCLHQLSAATESQGAAFSLMSYWQSREGKDSAVVLFQEQNPTMSLVPAQKG